MTSFRIRPRFKVFSDKSPIEIQERIEARLESYSDDCTGILIPNYFTLKIPYEQRHFWSPQLSLHLEEEDNQTIVRGMYGPHPNIWALFTFGYATIGVLTLFILMASLSKWSLGKSAMELWALPIFIIIAIALYFLSQVGQKLGVEETFRIHHFFEEALEQKISIT